MIVWPHEVLPARAGAVNLVPFTRSGGRSLGGLEPVTRTDRGYWRIVLADVILHTPAKRRVWNAIRVALGGRVGLISVPVWSHGSTPWPGGERLWPLEIPHGDDALHSDDSGYRQPQVAVKMADTLPIGSTSCRLQVVNADPDLTGVRFSYNGALYETGPATLVSGPYWTVPIFPAARAIIPAGADLEFDMPRCICRLVDDRGMDHPIGVSLIDSASVEFVEAVDYWSDLAAS